LNFRTTLTHKTLPTRNPSNPKLFQPETLKTRNPSNSSNPFPMPPIKIILTEDHQILRDGVKALIASENIEITGEAASGAELWKLLENEQPDIILMDISLPDTSGIELTRLISERFPKIKVLILSAHNDDAYVEKVAALGASGYLVKQTAVHMLKDAIRAIHKGNTFYSADVAKRFHKRHVEPLDRKNRIHANAPGLTSREAEVLQLIAGGSANKQVATKLGISIKTVEKHRDHLMRKLDIHDTAGLTRYAISAGVIENCVQVTIV